MADLHERLRSLDGLRPPDLWPDIRGREPRPASRDDHWRRGAVGSLALVVAAAGIAVAARVLLRDPAVTVVPIEPKANGKIVFSCGELPFNSDLCLMEDDHSPAFRLVTDVGQALNPDWSPDGSRIALQVGGGADSGGASIFVVSADGSGLHEVISGKDGEFDLDPDWSPDGTSIAFTRTPPGAIRGIDDDLFVADVDGGGVRKVFDSQTGAFGPTWSPDGKLLAFIQRDAPDGGRFDVFLLDVRDGRVTQVTRSGSATQAEWAPDGASLAFVEGGQIKRIRPDGTGERTLYECRCIGISGLAWAPDGSAILFVASANQGDQPGEQLFEMNADGTGLRQITFGSDSVCCPAWQPLPIAPTVEGSPLPTASPPSETSPRPTLGGNSEIGTIAFTNEHSASVFVLDEEREAVRIGGGLDPAWSPDGSRLAVTKTQGEGTQDIVVMRADGSGARTIVSLQEGTEVYGGGPTWSPDGTVIAFTGPRGLYRVGVERAGLHLIVDARSVREGCALRNAAWAPDGWLIAFDVDCEGGHEGIWAIAPDGSGLQRIGPRPPMTEAYSRPAWSPDGNRLVFEHEGSDFSYIGLMNVDGSGFTEVREGSDGHDRQPAWTSDGARIVFSDGSLDHEFAGIFVMELDGSNRTGVVGILGDAGEPAVRPDA